ncbi:Acryloyl-CoA reductase (NADH) [Paraconexibacter sp. AEG42_29]|uniref:Acryloyl-CoA reductase (NADH) n=1 Tax=Paraconexibacter sp. AEG42_29 TaxID=2997339 RepID=A0AAU7ARS9_9ACTN
MTAPEDVVIPPLVEDEPDGRGVVRRRARAVALQVAGDAARWDDEERFPESSLDALRAAGLTGLTVPLEHGGEGLGVGDACAVLEELATACVSSAMVAQLYLNGPPRALATLGTAAQRARYLPGAVSGERNFAIAISEPDAGSAATDLQTRLEPDPGGGYRLHGGKCYITGGMRADTVLVFCRLAGTQGSRGIGAVVVERSQPGFSSPHSQPKMGGRGVGESVLEFDGVAVAQDAVVVAPDAASAAGAAVMLRQFNPERCGNAAMALGAARAALELSLRHVRTREQFGRELAEFQGLQWKLCDMAIELDAARALLYRAADSDADGFPVTRLTAMAKIKANEVAERICHQAIQLHGHAGYTRDLPLERMYRDVRGMSLAGGTVEVMRNVLAGELLGRRFSQRA